MLQEPKHVPLHTRRQIDNLRVAKICTLTDSLDTYTPGANNVAVATIGSDRGNPPALGLNVRRCASSRCACTRQHTVQQQSTIQTERAQSAYIRREEARRSLSFILPPTYKHWQTGEPSIARDHHQQTSTPVLERCDEAPPTYACGSPPSPFSSQQLPGLLPPPRVPEQGKKLQIR